MRCPGDDRRTNPRFAPAWTCPSSAAGPIHQQAGTTHDRRLERSAGCMIRSSELYCWKFRAVVPRWCPSPPAQDRCPALRDRTTAADRHRWPALPTPRTISNGLLKFLHFFPPDTSCLPSSRQRPFSSPRCRPGFWHPVHGTEGVVLHCC